MNAPTVIRIQEQAEQNGQFHAAISFNHGPEYLVTVRDPFEQKKEAELEWYFEEHLRFPFTNQVRAKEAAASIATYGDALFTQVFRDNADVYAEYRMLLRTGLESVRIEIMGEPAFHAMHWEALKDPNVRQPLSLQAVMVRQNKEPPPLQADTQPSPTINLLVVTSRPYGVRDVSYRTISRPLVEALRQANVRVNITILRPGTYKTLVNHLEEMTGKHGAGYYHVIHFDVHGSLMSYAQLERLNKPSENEAERVSHRHTFQRHYALDDLQPFEGSKAFLFFEGEQNETVTPVEASALAKMLLTHHISIAILNACQSARQVGESATSLASHLMQAGVQLVLAMGYSITVTAAEKLMTALYQHLFAGDYLSLAIRHARAELYKDKSRRAYYAQQIDLEDWLLPVVYQNRPAHLTLRDLTPDESNAYYEQQADLSRTKPSEPTYGFIGRDLDILRIERRLLLSRNILLIRGMGGAGKTTLLRHLTTWWRSTGLVKQVFSFGYDDRAWARQQILVGIAQKLLDPVAYERDFQPLSLDAQQAFLARRLRAERHLLILDNLESITGAHLAIQHTLDTTEQEALRHFLTDLAGGKTLVLLGSRGGEGWLARGTFEKNVYDLFGLDPEAASMLADRILERHHATKYRQDDAFQHFLKLLDGFPLALEVVLSNLARQTPSEVLAGLRGGNIRLDIDESDQQGKDIFVLKTESILHCIDYSHSNLSPGAQHLLLCLAPFTSVFDVGTLGNYTDHLKQQSVLADLPVDRWQEVLQEAINWGLLRPDTDIPRFLRLQPTLTYFLRSRLAVSDQSETRDAINIAFRVHYKQVGDSLSNLLESNNPEERQVGLFITRLEYENLVTALHLALTAQDSIASPYLALTNYLDSTQNQQRGLELFQNAEKQFSAYAAEKLGGTLGFEYINLIGTIANWQLHLKQYEQAKTSYQGVLTRLDRIDQIDEQRKNKLKALTYHQIGILTEQERKFSQAEQYYQQALAIYDKFNDRYAQAKVYHQLGNIAQQEQKFPQAEQYYQQALTLFIEFDDRYTQASTYHNLGMIAHRQQKFTQAEQYYQRALAIYIEFNDRYPQADTYHYLGRVAQHEQKLQQAEQCYQEALAIYVEFNDRYHQADTYHQLGRVAQEQHQFEQAAQYYQQARAIYIEFNDRYSQASSYHQLGTVAQEQHQFEQAEDYYQQALAIFVEFNDRYDQAHTYYNLSVLAQEQRRWKQARDYLLLALGSFVAYQDIHYIDEALRNLARLWQESDDTDIPSKVAETLGVDVSEVEKILRQMMENESNEET